MNSLDDDFAGGMAELERIRDLAPGEIRDDIDVIMDTFREFEEVEAEGDEEAVLAAVMALALSPKFTQAAEAIETFNAEECGVETDTGGVSIDGFDAEESGPGVTVSSDGQDGMENGQIVTEAAPGVPDPLFDPFFDDEVDLGAVSIDGAKYYLDVNYTNTPWRTRLGSWTSFGSSPPALEVGGLDLTQAEANEVCAAMVQYLLPFDPDSTLVVSTYAQNDNGMFGDESPLLSTTAADGC